MARTNTSSGATLPLTADSIQGDGTLGNEIELVNDQLAPGNSQYYGTDGAGVKGYHAIPPSDVNSVSANDGSTTIIPNTGAVLVDVNTAHNFNWTGQHTFNSHLPTSTQTPISANELVTKVYTDTFALGLQVRPSVLAATITALPANTYNNGTLGVGATLTKVGFGALPVQDGVTLVNGDRLLVQFEVAPANNGFYNVTDVGSVGTPWILTRTVDYDQSAEVVAGTFTSVQMGITYGNKLRVMTTPGIIVMGTDSIVFGPLNTNTLGYTPEDVANKSNDVTMAANSAVLYPTQHAAKTYSDLKLAKLQNLADVPLKVVARANLEISTILTLFCPAFNPADNTTYYSGTLVAPSTTVATRIVTTPYTTPRNIIAVRVTVDIIGTMPSAGNVSFYLRTAAANTLIGSVAFGSFGRHFQVSNVYGGYTLNPGASLELVMVTPVWATNPTQVSLRADVYIQ